MLTREEARALAAAELGRLQANAFLRTPDSLVTMDERTIERSCGWIFFYNSRRYLEKRNPLDGLGGNAPFIINRHTGEVRPLARRIQWGHVDHGQAGIDVVNR
jgi:hypothetical protein